MQYIHAQSLGSMMDSVPADEAKAYTVGQMAELPPFESSSAE
jgi:hypothetical protein